MSERESLRARAIVALVLGVSVASCGGTQTIVKTVTSSSTTDTATTAAQTSAASQTSAAHQAVIGDTLKLQGSGGELMAVTVDQVMDPLQVGSADQADAGSRFVGVQITLKNVGSATYSDSPSNSATLLSNTNEQAKTAIVSGGPCGNDFQSSANIAPGATEQGCVPFQVPTGQSATSLQFTLNSGFANQTGQWSLAGASSASTSSPGATAAAPNTGTISPPSTTTANPGTLTACDANISAGAGTSCPFAENVFRAVAAGYQQNGSIPGQITASSPVTKQTYSLACQLDASQTITCTSPTGSLVTFSLHSVQVY